MLSNFSPQYPPLMSQFPGLQGAGWPQSSAYGSGIAPFSSGIAPFGYELAQQISMQSALIQQVSFALQQLAHQLAVHGLQANQGVGLGAAPPFGLGGPFATQGGYGGFTPQVQPHAWGANRAQTIQ